jgi:hypothetical protein
MEKKNLFLVFFVCDRERNAWRADNAIAALLAHFGATDALAASLLASAPLTPRNPKKKGFFFFFFVCR